MNIDFNKNIISQIFSCRPFLVIWFICISAIQYVFAQKQTLPSHEILLSKIENTFSDAQYDSSIYLSQQFLINSKNSTQYQLAKSWIARNQIKLGQFSKASQTIDSLLDLTQQLSQNLLINLLIDKSEIFLQRGYGENAAEIILKAEKMQEKSGIQETNLLAQLYTQKAIIYWNLGDFQPALEYAFNALANYKKASSYSALGEARLLNDIGLILMAQNSTDANTYFLKSKSIYTQLNKANTIEYANLLNNIAFYFKSQSMHKEAISIMDTVLMIRLKIYPSVHTNIAFTYASMANIYFEMKAYSSASEWIKKSLHLYQSLYSYKHPEIASAYNLLAQIDLEFQNPRQSIRHINQAIIANSYQFNDSLHLDANPNMGDINQLELMCSSLLLKAKSFEEVFNTEKPQLKYIKMAVASLSLADTVIWKLKNLRTNKNDKLRLSKWSSEIYLSLIRNHLLLSKFTKRHQYHHSKAFIYSERNKASILMSAIADANSKQFAGIPDSLIQKENFLKKEISFYEKELAKSKSSIESEKNIKQIFNYNTQYQKYITNLELKYPSYFQLKYQRDDKFSEQDAQHLLSNDEAMISYSIDDNNKVLYTFVLTKNKLRAFEQLLSFDFNRKISALRNSIVLHVKQVYQENAQELYKILLKNKIPSKVKTLYFIPDGRLSTIPLEALLTQSVSNSSGYSSLPYLLNNFNIAYHSSAILFCQKAQQKLDYKNTIRLVAPIEFSKIDNVQPADLPSTKEEVSEIALLFEKNLGKAYRYEYKKATEAILKSGDFDYSRIIHLATHGLVDENKPELSKIFLYPEANNSDDGLLYSGEIYNLKLNCDLITLSACQTGLGKITQGEGIIGLSRSLLYAGAKNILVSLWSVSDQSTYMLMKNFYTDLYTKENFQKGYSRSLRAAKLSIIKADAKFCDPYYWAAFTLIGK
ncbi:MAG: CHAT domain-containing protein [Cytophagales bacterium]|nr:MAG: CHAT domain-containing protein [Cytophagales bacterium]